MKSMVDLSHEFLLPALHSQAICIDATLGHGKDATFFLEQGVHKVYGFEIQEEVGRETENKIHNSRLHVLLKGHEHLDCISEDIDAIIFNFGYCPHGNKAITTLANTSLTAVQKGLNHLKRRGRMALVFYPHEKGLEEAQVIQDYLESLSGFEMIQMKKLGQENVPFLIWIEKR